MGNVTYRLARKYRYLGGIGERPIGSFSGQAFRDALVKEQDAIKKQEADGTPSGFCDWLEWTDPRGVVFSWELHSSKNR